MTALLHLRCFAKVNLTLDVLGRRTDGYHDIASLVHTIGLADDLLVEPDNALSCEVEGLTIAEDENLVTRAARLLAAEARVAPRAHIRLRKRIPAAAGLGGGSSDAAATLLALDRLWGSGFGADRLADLALQLGSDVPFFLAGGAAVLRGRGEQLETLPPLTDGWLVLLVPTHAVHQKTAALYRALAPADLTDGARTLGAAARLRSGEPLTDAACGNSFARAARAVFPGLDQTWRSAEEVTGRPFHLSGAGPALFAFAASETDAQAVAERLRSLPDTRRQRRDEVSRMPEGVGAGGSQPDVPVNAVYIAAFEPQGQQWLADS